MSKYLTVDPTVQQGEDEGSEENERGVWEWLVGDTDGMPVAERVALAEELGRDDIVAALLDS